MSNSFENHVDICLLCLRVLKFSFYPIEFAVLDKPSACLSEMKINFRVYTLLSDTEYPVIITFSRFVSRLAADYNFRYLHFIKIWA